MDSTKHSLKDFLYIPDADIMERASIFQKAIPMTSEKNTIINIAGSP